MPPHKPFLSLTNICIDWAIDYLFKSLKVQGAPNERLKQRKYITETLNSNIRQRLLNIVFEQHMYKWNLTNKCLMLEMLGDRSTQCIDFSKGGYAFIDEVWHFYRTLTIGLMINISKLGIVCNTRTESDKKYIKDINSTFYRVFNQMKNLRWVTLTGVADTILLEKLGTNCPHLEYLDVSQSCKIDDNSVASLLLSDPLLIEGRQLEQLGMEDIPTTPCANTLKIVCVSDTNVSLLSVAILLYYVSNLESLGGDVHAGSICSVMGALQPEHDSLTFNLYELSDAKILAKHASILELACPHLKRISTDAVSLDSIYNLSSISHLSVSLYYQSFVNEIYNYLLSCGENLKELKLTDHINSSLDLSWLVELTPHLEVIEATLTIEEGTEISEWPCLKTAHVSLSASKTVLALLTKAPALRDLEINFIKEPYQETFECINDNLIIYVLVDEGLKNLRRLKINECAIGMKGIDCLLFHCPDLAYLAPLSFWHGLSNQDIHSLAQKVKENNWLLKIIMRVDWEDGTELRDVVNGT